MKFSLGWLKDYLETDADAAAIATKLNAIGIEVESVEDPAESLAGFTVARVLTARPHPDADKLQVLTVDAGGGEPLQVVCGAPNARAGLVGVFGAAGAVVPANGMQLRKAAIRGVESNGMMCSSRELGLGDDHAGIIELPDDAPVGAVEVHVGMHLDREIAAVAAAQRRLDREYVAALAGLDHVADVIGCQHRAEIDDVEREQGLARAPVQQARGRVRVGDVAVLVIDGDRVGQRLDEGAVAPRDRAVGLLAAAQQADDFGERAGCVGRQRRMRSDRLQPFED